MDALDHLLSAVEHLIEAAERSKRQESIHFWAQIEKARESSRMARFILTRLVLVDAG